MEIDIRLYKVRQNFRVHVCNICERKGWFRKRGLDISQEKYYNSFGSKSQQYRNHTFEINWAGVERCYFEYRSIDALV
eukprot:15887_5